MKQFFQQNRERIGEELLNAFGEWKSRLSRVSPWGEDYINRLRDFTLQGKMLRGGLIILSYRMFGSGPLEPLLQLAAAIELMQSALLIHDDIMDRDKMRRGGASIFHQYRMMAESEGIEEPLHYGESLGICAGDIGFFLAFEILAKIDVPSRLRQRIQETWSAAFTTVGLAQMQDMFLSGIHRDIGEDDIIDLYRTKTASYTFSLPLVTGAVAAGVDQATTRTLDRIGAYMGIAFQIKDDELDLFGTEGETGKPVGTDMEEGKKTLYHHHLLKLRSTQSGRLENGETEALQSLASGNIMDRHVVSELRRMAEKHGIRVRVRETMNQFSKRAEQMAMTLSADETYRDLLLDVLHYNTHRRG